MSCDQNMEVKEIDQQHGGKNKSFREPAHIDVLDDDCLAKIFTYLSLQERLEVEKVCTRWRTVALENWHDVKILDFLHLNSTKNNFRKKKHNYNAASQLLTRCGRFLEILRIPPICNSKILEVVNDNCHNLYGLKLELRKYSKNHLLGAFSKMKKLQSIAINNYHGGISLADFLRSIPEGIKKISFDVQQIGFNLLPLSDSNELAKFSELRWLSINSCILSNIAIEAIGQNRNLIFLNLNSCYLMCNVSLEPISQLLNLESLDIGYSYGFINLESFNEPMIFIRHGVDDRFLINLAENNSKTLRFLNLSHCTLITEHGLKELRKFENLVVLNISGIEWNKNVNLQLWPFPKLKRLYCGWTRAIDDNFVRKILDYSPKIEFMVIIHASISTETLQYVIDITKKRENKKILNLFVHPDVKHKFDKLENKSRYLKVFGTSYFGPL